MRARFLVAGVAMAAGVAAVVIVPAVRPASSAEPTVQLTVARALPRAAEPVVHRFKGYAGKCITVPGSSDSPDGAGLVLQACSDSLRQVFTGTALGEARTLDGMCLDVAWGSPDNGAKVQVARCNGGAAQRWYVMAENGAPTGLYNLTTRKCVDVKDWNDSDGAPLQMWDCVPGQANQTWALVGA